MVVLSDDLAVSVALSSGWPLGHIDKGLDGGGLRCTGALTIRVMEETALTANSSYI